MNFFQRGNDQTLPKFPFHKRKKRNYRELLQDELQMEKEKENNHTTFQGVKKMKLLTEQMNKLSLFSCVDNKGDVSSKKTYSSANVEMQNTAESLKYNNYNSYHHSTLPTISNFCEKEAEQRQTNVQQNYPIDMEKEAKMVADYYKYKNHLLNKAMFG